MTGSSGDTFVTTVAANGATSLVTTDAAAAAAHLQITADGTVDIDSAGVLTLDSGAAINIEPAAGSAILLDGTISVDAGVVTGATSITSTAFVGALTGAASSNLLSTGGTLTGDLIISENDPNLRMVDTNTNSYSQLTNSNGSLKIEADLGSGSGGSTLEFTVDNTTMMTIDATGAATMPLQPAFLAQPGSAQTNIALNSDEVVVFGVERFDQNADFASNDFTAPVTGRYQFNYTLRVDQIDSAATFFQMKLVTSNRTFTSTFDSFTEADIDYFTFNGSDLVDMDANDTAYIVFRQQGGTQQADIDTEARFSGFLAC